MPNNVFRADDTAFPTVLLSSELAKGQSSTCPASSHPPEQREAVWLQWEELWLTEMALRVDDVSDGGWH